jgi:chaperone BCS1
VKLYGDCGIPYRRGYLFYGPPGTGKTSLSAALAGHLRCELYLINLSANNMSDGRLHQLFLRLPLKCVVVLEDVDAAGLGRERKAPPMADSGPDRTDGNHPLMRQFHGDGGVTLSGLLNAIDGNASQEGRLLIMVRGTLD